MKLYTVTFVVQAENMIDAVRQAEGYLNTDDRVIDFDCRTVMPLPKEAPVLPVSKPD